MKQESLEKAKRETLRNYVWKSIGTLNEKNLGLLKKILDPKQNAGLQLNIEPLHNLMREITGFEIVTTTQGYMLKFDSKAITTYHRQHGKALHIDVIKKIHGVFDSLQIRAEHLPSEKSKESKQSKLKKFS